MRQKVHIKPTPVMSRMGIIVGVAFFIFGLIFLAVLINEGSGIGIVFVIFWLFVVGVIIAFNVYNLVRRKDVIDIETESEGRANGQGPDFDSKLRKLETLKKDGLISEEEFRAKREEIFRQTW